LGARLVALNERDKSLSDSIGNFLINALPVVIKGLGFIGTVALILVAGGIFVHNLEFVHHLLETWPAFLSNMLTGLAIGLGALFLVKGYVLVRKKLKPGSAH
jgi:predicted DNA repair protein MutK